MELELINLDLIGIGKVFIDQEFDLSVPCMDG